MKFYGSAMIIAVILGGQHYAEVNAINLRQSSQLEEPTGQYTPVNEDTKEDGQMVDDFLPPGFDDGIIPELREIEEDVNLDPELKALWESINNEDLPNYNGIMTLA